LTRQTAADGSYTSYGYDNLRFMAPRLRAGEVVFEVIVEER
jgi:hypothetical protein